LGSSTGADTARQTDALIGQISAAQSIDRRGFEFFLAEIGKKIATLIFENEAFEMETRQRVPGTKIEYTQHWPPMQFMPNFASIDDFNFEVAQFSTAFRTPQERVNQLQTASQLVMTWMQAAAQGLPINIGAIIESVGTSFDLVPELEEWWSGEPPPTPQEKVDKTYTSLAEGPQGSDIRYLGAGDQQQQAAASPALQSPQGGVL